MQTFILDQGLGYKLFMLLSFSIFSSVMYQGHISAGGIYSILFFVILAICAFHIASIIYVLLVKRNIEIYIDEENISWKIYDNNKLYKENSIKIKNIKKVTTEVNYLTGNFYSTFQVIFKMNNEDEVILTDGLLYDFGLKKAEDVCKLLLNNNLGDEQDIKFAKLTKELNINLSEEQIFTKKDAKSFFVGVISKNKKEFLGLRLQIENLYPEYKDIQKNANNEFLVKSATIKDSYIFLRSNAIGYIIEFYNVSRKEDLKTLKQMGKHQKIGF